MKRETLAAFIFLFLCSLVNAQTSKNPFELIPRLDPSEILQDSSGLEAEEFIPGNPFDIVYTPVPEKTKRRIKKEKKAQDKENSYRRFLFAVVMSVLVVLTLLMTMFRSLFAKAYWAFVNDNMMNQLYREKEGRGILLFLVLYSNFLINLGLFVFFLSKIYEFPSGYGNVRWLFYCILGVSGLIVLKHLLLKIIGFIFPVSKEINLYNFTIIVFGIVLGVILVPVNVFISYGPSEMIPALIRITFVVIILIYLFRSLRGLFIANKFLVFYKFHFLLYICTVEIGPVLIITKLLLGKF